MEEHTRQYEYAGEYPDADLADVDGPEMETIIVDGAAMSYRTYRRRRRAD